MIGRLPKGQNSKSYQLCLEQFIPADHLLRRIDRFVDFTPIRQHLLPTYSKLGRPSIDPELMLRMLLIGYCYGIRSERRLCEEVRYNLAYRWFCRLGLEDTIPDHSTFSKNRHGRFRVNDTFRAVFNMVVEQCVRHDLVPGTGFAVDASQVQADVNRFRSVKGNQPIDWGPVEQQSRPVREYLQALDADAFACSERKRLSLIDPLARWTAAKGFPLFAYSTNYMIDVEHGIILDVEACPSYRIDEVSCAKHMLERIEVTHHLKPERLLGDAAYGSAQMLGYLVEEKGIEPHVTLMDKSVRHDGTYSAADFNWDEARNEYRCPNGKVLHTTGRVTQENTLLYRSRNADCAVCPRKSQCCPNSAQRKIVRSIFERAREVARRIHQLPIYHCQSLHQRKKVEMLFGHMKAHLNLMRLRLRGLTGARDEFLLVATAQNLRRMARLRSQPPPATG